MDFGANKTHVEIIKKRAFGGTYFRGIYVVLMVNGMESHEKNLMSLKILIKSITAQLIIMLVLINTVLNVEHHYDFGKIKDGFLLLILIVGFSGILDIG